MKIFFPVCILVNMQGWDETPTKDDPEVKSTVEISSTLAAGDEGLFFLSLILKEKFCFIKFFKK